MQSQNRSNKDFYTLEERYKVQELVRKGVDTSSIARVLNRSRISIYKEIVKGGGRNNYNAEETHKTIQNSLKERASRGGQTTKRRYTEQSNGYGPRISVLEMQVKLLFELAKEIKDEITNKRL